MQPLAEALSEWTREMSLWASIKAVAAGGLTVALELLGYPESAIIWLLYLVVADFILGFSRAWKMCTISPRKFYRGVSKTLLLFISVALIGFLDKSFSAAFKTEYLSYEIQDFYIIYLCIGQFLSCAGHLAFFGMPFPESFLKRLEQYRKHIEEAPFKRRGADITDEEGTSEVTRSTGK
jgi:toxin secretion/phage lysis holin